MRATLKTAFAAAALTVSVAGAAQAIEITVLTSNDPKLTLGSYSFPNGKKLDASVGVGSAAFRRADEPADQIWTAGDRGPNIECEAAKEIVGVEGKDFGPGGKGRIYPFPDYSPSIYRIVMDPAAKTFRVADVIAIKDKDGKPITGLLNPLTVATTEIPLDGAGKPLALDPNALDVEGVVRLPDGTFWIGDENGPSVAHIAADGKVLKRIVPIGTEKDYAKANYPVEAKLPAILAKRWVNRGIESVALSPDDKTLYAVVQNPLANPDREAYQAARSARIIAIDLATETVSGEFVYEMDPISTYKLDTAKANSTVRISEAMALSGNRLVVLERTEKTTKLYEIALSAATNILGSKWDDAATSPSLETVALEGSGVKSAPKTLRLDSADHKEIPVKIEGMAIAGDGRLVLINDDDFGITGERTKIMLIKDTGIVR